MDFAHLIPGFIVAGRYRVERMIKSGGMGAVYEAVHTGTHRRVALKVMHPNIVEDPAMRRRFAQEARVAARVQSRHVVDVLDAGVEEEAGAAPFLVMELLSGRELGDRVKTGPLPMAEALDCLEQLAEGLEAAHDAGVVHRDIKPENLFLSRLPEEVNEPPVLKILDFGIAKLTEGVFHESTASNGTPLYMAPEQLGRAIITPSADIWSFGLVAYTLFVGKPYWRVESVAELYGALLGGEYPSAVAQARAEGVVLPPAFDSFFRRCVARETSDRYAHIGEAITTLRSVMTGAERLDAFTSGKTEIQVPRSLFAGKYDLVRRIGVGGMGEVHLATHSSLGHQVAIKVLHRAALAHPGAIERFHREGRAAVSLKSVHVARVLDTGVTEGGEPYMVMEYLEGKDLSEHLTLRGALPLHEAVFYVLQACEAIAEAHGKGIVHRDLKPANLFLTRSVDGLPLVKVLDFGISKLSADAQQGANLELTQTRTAMGSPSYMSPEQLRSARSVDARADLWSIGVILHELVTGVLPFQAETLTELTAKVLTDAPPLPSSLRQELPKAIDAVISKCLTKERELRYANVAELARDLEPLSASMPASWTGAAARVERSGGLMPASGEPVLSSSGERAGGTGVSWGATGEHSAAARRSEPPLATSTGGRRLAFGAGAVLALLAVAIPVTVVLKDRASVASKSPDAVSSLPLPADRKHLPVLASPSASASASVGSVAEPSFSAVRPVSAASAVALPSSRGPQRAEPARGGPPLAASAPVVAPAKASAASPTPPPVRPDPNAMPEERR